MSAASASVVKSAGSRLLRRFRRIVIIAYLATIVVTLPGIYYYTYQNAYAEATQQLALLRDFISSMRDYIIKDLRPTLLQAEVFHAPAISGVAATAHLAKHFATRQPNYYLRFASDNPLNSHNQAQSLEKQLLVRYRGDDSLEKVVETGLINGRTYLVSSERMVARPGCLQCHGDNANAPEAIRVSYGLNSGYNYQVGSIVGVGVVGVPIADINSLALQRGGVALAVLTLIFGIVFLSIDRLVRRGIILPVLQITQTAAVVSRGEMSKEIDTSTYRDEIRDLGEAFERMRASLAIAMRRLKSQ